MAANAKQDTFPSIETTRECYRQQPDSLGVIWSNWYTDDVEWHRAPVNLASYCKIKCPRLSQEKSESRLRSAWIALRYYNLGIASNLVRDEGCEARYRAYKTPSEDDLRQWTWKPFRVHSHRMSPQGVVFNDQAQFLPRVRDLLLGLPARPTIPAYIRAVRALGKTFVPDAIALPRRADSEGIKDRNIIMRHTMTKQQTPRLHAACRSRNITVTAAFPAAHMLSCQTAWNDATKKPRDQYMSFEMFDVRPWIRRPFDPRGNFGTDYYGLIPCRFDFSNGRSYDVLAKEIDAWLKSVRQEHLADPAGMDAILYVTQSFLGGPTPDPLPPWAPVFGGFDVQSGVLCNSGSINRSWIWTFDNCFNILFTRNEACYGASMFEQLMRNTVDRLGWLV
ncbi:hypothetical protein HIM_10057 [Hirsutella minnesotensis 3608]|uniref:Uncharacterized protein n=1 Tax=Hirsutella minnesotensis 3608 TaxID=1043627 RepID=A0A0F8A2N3_9HYPO|nr:hypothetical protein HIM_10057 [Hirsutella minnesotensis 3608]